MYQVFDQHKGGNLQLPDASLDTVRLFADCAAEMGFDSFFRVFKYDDTSATGVRFETAFSVLSGEVKEHKDVTFPLEHWG